MNSKVEIDAKEYFFGLIISCLTALGVIVSSIILVWGTKSNCDQKISEYNTRYSVLQTECFAIIYNYNEVIKKHCPDSIKYAIYSDDDYFITTSTIKRHVDIKESDVCN